MWVKIVLCQISFLIKCFFDFFVFAGNAYHSYKYERSLMGKGTGVGGRGKTEEQEHNLEKYWGSEKKTNITTKNGNKPNKHRTTKK